jgi:hypothetical protein
MAADTMCRTEHVGPFQIGLPVAMYHRIRQVQPGHTPSSIKLLRLSIIQRHVLLVFTRRVVWALWKGFRTTICGVQITRLLGLELFGGLAA